MRNRGLKNLKRFKKKEEKEKKNKTKTNKKRMIIEIVKVFLGLSQVLLWAVWGQFIFG